MAAYLRYDRCPAQDTNGLYRMKMKFVRNADGQPAQRSLHTSAVQFVEETEKGLKIHTQNAVFVMEETEIKALVSLEEANLIELYLSLDEDCHFAAGL